MKEKIDINKINIQFVVSFFIILFLGVGVYLYQNRYTQSFLFNTINNKKFHINSRVDYIEIKELKGKTVFLKIFGWNCQYCQKEIPELISLKNKFGSSFDVISIQQQKYTKQESLDFVKQYHINYSIVDGNNNKNFMKYLEDVYGWKGVIPLTIILDPKGKILAFEVGYKSYSLTSLLKSTLQMITTVAVEQ